MAIRHCSIIPSGDSIIMTTTTYSVRSTKDIDTDKLETGMTTVSISRTDGKKGKSGLCIVVPQVSDSIIALVQQDQYGKAWLIDSINAVRGRIASIANKQGKLILSDAIGISGILAAMKADTE